MALELPSGKKYSAPQILCDDAQECVRRHTPLRGSRASSAINLAGVHNECKSQMLCEVRSDVS